MSSPQASTPINYAWVQSGTRVPTYDDAKQHDATFCEWYDPSPPQGDCVGQYARGRRYLNPPANEEEKELRRESWQYPGYEDLEPITSYRPGGYHPVSIGDTLCGRYKIVDKLGFGSEGTVWRVRDQDDGGKDLALKICRADKPYHQEVVMPNIPYNQYTTNQIDIFPVHGPNGLHHAYTMRLCGSDLRKIMTASPDGFRLKTARRLCLEIIVALSSMHEQSVIHGDLSLSNVLLRNLPAEDSQAAPVPFTERVVRRDGRPLALGKMSQAVWSTRNVPAAELLQPEDCSVMICDFGGSCRDYQTASSPNWNQRLGRDYRGSADVRCPEALWLPSSPLTLASDIWSLGVLMWELLTNVHPFEIDPVNEQLQLLGPRPVSWPKEVESHSSEADMARWAANGVQFPKLDENHFPQLRQTFKSDIEECRNSCVTEATERMTEQEQDEFVDLIWWMWQYEPRKRANIEDVLGSVWCQRWADPSAEVKLRSF